MRAEASEQLERIDLIKIGYVRDAIANLQMMTTFFISHTDESSKAFWV